MGFVPKSNKETMRHKNVSETSVCSIHSRERVTLGTETVDRMMCWDLK